MTIKLNSSLKFRLTKLDDGTFDSRYQDGDKPGQGGGGGNPTGGTAALAWEGIDGDLAHGSRLRVTTNDPLGPKSQAAQKHWEMGGDARINGSIATPSPIGGIPSSALWGQYESETSVVNTSPRHSRLDRYYQVNGMGKVGYSQGFSSGTNVTISASDGNQFYLANWVKCGHNFFRTRMFDGLGAITGSFNINADRTRGELVDVTNGGTTRQAYITYISNGVMTLDVEPDILIDPAFIQGATITGQQSGASVTISGTANVISPIAFKFNRIQQTYSMNSDYPNMSAIYSCTNQGELSLAQYDGAGAFDGMGSYDASGIGSPAQDNTNNWSFIETILDYSGATGTATQIMDGVIIAHITGIPLDNLHNTQGFVPAGVGIDTPGLNYSGGSFAQTDAGVGGAFDSIVSDNDTRRFILTDNIDYASSNKFEVQYNDVWNADGSVIDLEINRGSIGDAEVAYLHRLDGATVIDSVEVA